MNIIINRSDAIGDTILTMPMAKFIKDHTPQSKIVFIISPRSKELFDNHPYVDDVWVIDPKGERLKVISFLKQKFKEFSPDAYFYVGGSQLPSLVAWTQGVPLRGGLKSKWQTFFLLNKGIRQKRSAAEMHESIYNLSLLAPLGIPFNPKNKEQYAPQIHLDQKLRDSSLKEFRESAEQEGKDASRELCFIHPGMTGHTLNWSSKNYAKLLVKMEENYPGKFSFVISYTPSDLKYVSPMKEYLQKEMDENLQKRVIDFDGSKKGLRHYMGVLSRAQLFIGPSTGTTHIANTLGVKVVGLYSPLKVQSSTRWGPFNDSPPVTRLLVPDVDCGELKKCTDPNSPFYHSMDKVEVDDVLESVRQLIAE